MRRPHRRPDAATASLADTLEQRLMLTVFVVDIATDIARDGDGSTDGQLSLREAITAATTDAAFGDAAAGSGNDSIVFAGNISTITLQSELLVNGGGGLTIDGGGDVTLSGGNATHILELDRSGAGAAGGVVLQNITLTEGQAAERTSQRLSRFANLQTVTADQGGLVAHLDGTRLLVRNATFTDSVAEVGGAIYSAQGNLVVRDSTFSGNEVTRDDTEQDTFDSLTGAGGAIHLDRGSLTLRDNLFTQNTGVIGGAISLERAQTDSRGDVFERNTTTAFNGFNPGRGAAIYLDFGDEEGASTASTLQLADGRFIDNEAGVGAAIHREGNDGDTMTITGSLFRGNESLLGGAIYTESESEGTPLRILNSRFVENTAENAGAIATSGQETVVVSGSTLVRNTAETNGGAIEAGASLVVRDSVIRDNTAGEFGGGIDAAGENGRLKLSNVDVIGNTAQDGGGIYAGPGLEIVNRTLIAENTAETDAGSFLEGRGGGVYVLVSFPDGSGNDVFIADSTIRDNRAISVDDSSRGGGIALEGVRRGLIRNATITGNSSTGNGGGIAMLEGRRTTNGTLRVENSQLGGLGDAGNTASIGGGLVVEDAARVRIVDTNVVGNVATFAGGGLGVRGGEASLTVDGGAVVSNLAADGGGGGMVVSQGTTVLRSTLVDNNTTTDDGGGVLNFEGQVVLIDTIIRRNTASSGGGVANFGELIAFRGGLRFNSATTGGGLYQSTVDVAPSTQLRNTFVVGNQATGDGGGGAIETGTLDLFAASLLDNTAGNRGGGLFLETGATLSGASGSRFARNSPDDVASA